jgi:nitroimidazol reductase NimA-like FMN-containing flavoprotein (pyridoxamine 5'-phosphate oxidase superfamily)
MEGPAAGLRELPRARCLELLASTTVGRVGVSVRALPVILPVTYALVGGRVIFRTAPGLKLEAAMHRMVIAFEADRYDPLGAWGWSVLVQGVASEITDPAGLAEARGHLAAARRPFLDEGGSRIVSVDSTLMSGRDFGRVPPA